MELDDEKRRSNLWYATSYVDEYFRLLGNLPIPYEYAVKDLIDFQIWEQTDGLPAKTLERVGKYQPTAEDMDWFTVRVTKHYPMTYNHYEKEEWQQFLERRLTLLNTDS